MSVNGSSSGSDCDAGGHEDQSAFLVRAIRFLDGDLDESAIESFNAELCESDEKVRALARLHLQGAMIRHSLRQAAYEEPVSPSPGVDSPVSSRRHDADVTRRQATPWGLVTAVAASLALAVGAYFVGRVQVGWAQDQETVVQNGANTPTVAVGTKPGDACFVRLTNSSRAGFFGELVPSAQSFLLRNHDYVLTAGMVELLFPAGASAIIESPAIFRIVDNACLAMDAGDCSVNAPEGAEGFRVETPTMRVVDRGTRFAVSVGENSDTEVQVIEGAADVYDLANTELVSRLTDHDARRFSGGHRATATELVFSPQKYRTKLPDRVVSYQVSTVAAGGADELQSVTVQRGGHLQTVSVNELIGVTLTRFHAGAELNRNGHFAASEQLPRDRLTLLSDHSLRTGVINPGGSVLPLRGEPNGNTPGFAVQFDSPVANEPGPDIVFFELQCLSNPVEGDAFHVSPLPFLDGRKSHTVSAYDLTLASPEVPPLAGFNLYQFSTPIESLDQLVSKECRAKPVRLGFRAVAVGIDLSDLGLRQGETIGELFFQDASDNKSSIVDPVFIGGLPSATSRIESQDR